jgi:ankyrin repeat protein
MNQRFKQAALGDRSLLEDLSTEELSLVEPGNGYTLLIYATLNEHYHTVKLLLEKGIEVNTRETLRGMNALMHAIEIDNTKIALLLIEQPSINFDLRNHKGENALMLAVQKGNAQLVKALIEKSDLMAFRNDGKTAFHLSSDPLIGDVLFEYLPEQLKYQALN